jgi:hypothetical protein
MFDKGGPKVVFFQFKCDPKHTIISKLLKSWNDVLSDLESAMKPWDLPYVYRERPNLGILAAAATRIGYVPFEEYSAQKGRGKNRRTGRADLWLSTTNGKKAFDFEAKYILPSFQSNRLAKTIQHHLDIACNDAKAISYKSNYTIGVVFISPYGASIKNFNPNVFWNRLSKLKQYKGDFCALHICSPTIWLRSSYKDRPGVAIVGRYI